jgi:MFS family permease
MTTIYSLGAMIGALSSGQFYKYGKWNMIMACNLTAAVGYVFTIMGSLATVFVGRFLLGAAIGGYGIYCPKFINEISPLEIRAPVGACL